MNPRPSKRSASENCHADSTPVEEPKNPDTDNLYALFKLFAPAAEVEEVRQGYLRGGLGYGEVKKRLAGHIIDFFAEARERRVDWLAAPQSRERSPGTPAAERAREIPPVSCSIAH